MIGIYMIENKINGKKYIGQSWDIEKRWYGHRHSEKNVHLRSAFNKYGIDNFEFRVLCDFDEHELTQDYLNDLEIAYIDILCTSDPNKGYNKNFGGALGSKPTKETRTKISNGLLGKRKGIPRKPETKQKISAKLKGIKKPPLSAERKQSIRAFLRSEKNYWRGKTLSNYHIAKRTCTRLGYTVEFELEAPGTKVVI